MIQVFDNTDEVYEEAAKRIAAVVLLAVNAKGSANIVLTGGNTPRGVYQRLVREPYHDSIAWDRIRFFWTDERCVPPDSQESNYRMVRETLLDHVPAEEDCIFRIKGEEDPEEAAMEYHHLLSEFVTYQTPCFDLSLMGMGEDGHTASLFPGNPALEESSKLALAVTGPKPPAKRITMTLPALNSTRLAMFLVTGSAKAGALASALNPQPDETPPAARITPPGGDTVWLVDRQAASKLPSGTP